MNEKGINTLLNHKTTKTICKFIFVGFVIWASTYIVFGGGVEWALNREISSDHPNYFWYVLSFKGAYICVVISVLLETFGLDKYYLSGLAQAFLSLMLSIALIIIALASFVLLIWGIYQYPNQVTAIFTVGIFYLLKKLTS